MEISLDFANSGTSEIESALDLEAFTATNNALTKWPRNTAFPPLARVAARPQIAALGTTSTTCKEKQLPWQLVHARRVELIRLNSKHTERVRSTLFLRYVPAKTPQRRFVRSESCQKRDAVIEPPTAVHGRIDARPTLTKTPRTGAHPFSSFEKTLQGREAVEENLYIRDKEAAAKYKREAELQAGAGRRWTPGAFKEGDVAELATMLHQKHLAERQRARASECRFPQRPAHPPCVNGVVHLVGCLGGARERRRPERQVNARVCTGR